MNRLEVITMSETAYKDAIIRLSNGKIVYDHYNDFDSDGICEMFAIVGEEIDADTIRGEIWFVNQQGANRIEESKYYWKYPSVYLFDDDMFVAFEEYYTTGSVTYLWGIKNGKPFQPISLEDCVIGEGNILRALNTSLAVYPDDFDIGGFE